jgi:hypothetical protein
MKTNIVQVITANSSKWVARAPEIMDAGEMGHIASDVYRL